MIALIPALLGLVSQVAPSLISALAGPKAGDVASKVVAVAQVVTGTDNQDAAAATLKADPAKMTELQERLAQIALEAAQAEYADTASARAMATAGGIKSPVTWGAPVISAVVMALFAAVMMGWTPHPDASLAQVLISAVTWILGFWFGSSRRDPQTDALLANSIPSHMTGGAAQRPLS